MSRAVHPRACGEHVRALTRVQPAVGSSPRPRGTRPVYCTFLTRASVHPRARGEHEAMCADSVSSGSSPRMRGTLIGHRALSSGARFIPAHAGNTGRSSRHIAGLRRFIPAHAGNTSIPFQQQILGSSPRTRGTSSMSAQIARRPVHPRARGEHIRTGPCDSGTRFIPAHAGNTGPLRTCPLCPRRFIPAHAGNTAFTARGSVTHGSSPRTRGTPPNLILRS